MALSALAPIAPAAAVPARTDCAPGTRLLGVTDDLDKATYAGLPVGEP